MEAVRSEAEGEPGSISSTQNAEAKEEEIHTAMLWSIQEAVHRQTLQIGVSACGATAVVDVLQALGITVTPDTVNRCVRTCLRRNEAPLPDYLHSRSKAGTSLPVLVNEILYSTAVLLIFCCKVAITHYRYHFTFVCNSLHPGATHQQLIDGADQASGARIMGRFFSLYPRRRLKLVPWLARWILRGAVPVATMNMQRAVPEGEEIPDAWHHQLIFGVGPGAVFMTNPLDVGAYELGTVKLIYPAVCQHISYTSVLFCMFTSLRVVFDDLRFCLLQ